MNMDKPNAIEVENVVFNYPDGHEVLKGVTCTIKAGEKVALIGPNGAGKSTFMNLLNGVSLATEGSVIIEAMEVTKHNLSAIRKKVGIVFQARMTSFFAPLCLMMLLLAR